MNMDDPESFEAAAAALLMNNPDGNQNPAASNKQPLAIRDSAYGAPQR